jgi:hypothetical protein
MGQQPTSPSKFIQAEQLLEKRPPPKIIQPGQLLEHTPLPEFIQPEQVLKQTQGIKGSQNWIMLLIDRLSSQP